MWRPSAASVRHGRAEVAAPTILRPEEIAVDRVVAVGPHTAVQVLYGGTDARTRSRLRKTSRCPRRVRIEIALEASFQAARQVIQRSDRDVDVAIGRAVLHSRETSRSARRTGCALSDVVRS